MQRFIFDVCFGMVFRLEFPSAWISMEWEQSVESKHAVAECFAELCLPNPKLFVSLPSLWVSSECPYVALLPGKLVLQGTKLSLRLYETSKEIETL